MLTTKPEATQALDAQCKSLRPKRRTPTGRVDAQGRCSPEARGRASIFEGTFAAGSRQWPAQHRRGARLLCSSQVLTEPSSCVSHRRQRPRTLVPRPRDTPPRDFPKISCTEPAGVRGGHEAGTDGWDPLAKSRRGGGGLAETALTRPRRSSTSGGGVAAVPGRNRTGSVAQHRLLALRGEPAPAKG
jgi:hypothetical protein